MNGETYRVILAFNNVSGAFAKFESPNSMKTLNYLVAFVCLSMGIQQVLAQPPANNQQRQQRFRQLLQRFDENGNGQLDPNERMAVQKFIQQRNGNNSMQLPQMRRPQNPNQRPQGQRREGMMLLPRKREHKLDKSRLLNRFDINRDGQLSASERAAAIEAMGK